MVSLDKIYGCLMGIAIGDAMGMPGLYSHYRTVEVYGTDLTTFIEPTKDPSIDPIHFLLPAGMVTDDTYAALAIVKSFIQMGRLCVEDIARHYVDWVDMSDALMLGLGRSKGLAGPSTRVAIDQLRAGVSPWETGRTGSTNGAAMRAAPVGFLHPGDLKATVDEIEITCIPTHNTNVAISAASAVACAVSATAGDAVSVEEVVRAAIEGSEIGRERGVRVYCPSLAKRIEMAMNLAASGKPRHEICQDLYDLVGAGLLAYETVPTAMGILLLGGGDPITSIRLAVNTGGDCDTLGAIVGGIVGAIAGAVSIPTIYKERIESVNKLGLMDLGEAFLAAITRTHQEEASSTR